MLEAVLAALVAIATRGECLEANHYPTDTSAVTGYVLIGPVGNQCVIPTTPELTSRAACDIAWSLADPTGLGSGIRCEEGSSPNA